MQSLRNHFRVSLTLAFPVMLAQLGHVLVSAADSMMVGQTGEVPLAAISLGLIPFHIIMTFGLGISYGSTPLIAAADGEGDRSRISAIFKHSFIINMIFSAFLVAIVFGFSNMLSFWGQSEEVVELAIPFLEVVTFSLIPMMVFQTYRQFMEGLSMTKPAMYISIFANALNIFLNYLLIFGKWGFEPMGMMGAAWATLVARVIMMIIIILYFYANRKFAVYRDGLWRMPLEAFRFKRILKIAVPAAFQYIIEVGAFSFAIVMMGWISTTMQAAHQIAINLAAITYMMATGFSSAATIRVGNQLGRKDIPNLRRAVLSILILVVFFMSISALIFVFGREVLPLFYNKEPEVVAAASGLLIMAALFQISDGLQVVAIGALRGLEDTLVPSYFIFIAYLVVGIPLGYFLGFELNWGAYGIWTGLCVGLTVTAITLLIRFNKLSKRLL